MLRVLSLGAGVQSTAVALMALEGELPPLDAAIFSDTGWESPDTYAHLDRLEDELVGGGVDVRRVSAGNIRKDHVDPEGEHLFIRTPRRHPEYLGKQRTFIPVFLVAPDGADARFTGKDGKGRARRTCTKTYKIEPVEREVRALLGLEYRERWPTAPAVEQVFGISWDESERMADPSRPAIVHDYPLVDARLTRLDCEAWLLERGWVVPRSACVGCPFRTDAEWRLMRDERPEEFADAVDFDHRFRARQEAGLLPMEGKPFLHRARVPLDEVDLDLAPDGQLDLFGEECAGYCGT